jgi:HSP20 family protein
MTLLRKNTDDLMPMRSLFNDLLDMDRFFGNDSLLKGLKKMPSANIIEKENRYEIELAAPGMDKKDFKIELSENILTISAERKEEKKEEKENFTRQEFSYNSFTRSFEVPASVNAEAVDAQYKDGILMLTLPKKEEARKKNKKEIAVG